jgi:hypothetical protein
MAGPPEGGRRSGDGQIEHIVDLAAANVGIGGHEQRQRQSTEQSVNQ